MKRLITLISLVILLPAGQLIGQSWAPEGAEWYYEYENFWYEGYVHILVSGDTVIHDTACRILEKTSVIRNLELDTTIIHHIGKEFMYSDEDKVFLFSNNHFYVLYDFSSLPGDHWTIPHNDDLPMVCDPEGEIIVTDTATVEINGQQLRSIVVEPMEGSHWAIYGEIIESIGPVDMYMLPEPDWYCVVDLFEGGRLRCYEDPDFGLYSTGISPTCDYIVGINEAEDQMFSIFPNPCGDFINVKCDQEVPGALLNVYNCGGQLILSTTLTQPLNQINVTDLVPGIYSLNIQNRDHNFSRSIIIR